jgi:hypothetical protein
MKLETDFYREIADIPPLPPELWESVDHTIHRRSRIKKSLFALAASIVVLIGAMTLIFTTSSRINDIKPEVANELQIIHDYLNSSDLEGDLGLYAVVEGY